MSGPGSEPLQVEWRRVVVFTQRDDEAWAFVDGMLADRIYLVVYGLDSV